MFCLKHSEHEQRMNCWALLGVKKGMSSLLKGSSTCPSATFLWTYFISLRSDLPICCYRGLGKNICLGAGLLRQKGKGAEGLTGLLLHRLSLTLCWNPMPHYLALPRSWCLWNQSLTGLIPQRKGRNPSGCEGFGRELGVRWLPSFSLGGVAQLCPSTFYCSWCFSCRATQRLHEWVIRRHLCGNFSTELSCLPHQHLFPIFSEAVEPFHSLLSLLLFLLSRQISSLFTLLPPVQGVGGGGEEISLCGQRITIHRKSNVSFKGK